MPCHHLISPKLHNPQRRADKSAVATVSETKEPKKRYGVCQAVSSVRAALFSALQTGRATKRRTTKRRTHLGPSSSCLTASLGFCASRFIRSWASIDFSDRTVRGAALSVESVRSPHPRMTASPTDWVCPTEELRPRFHVRLACRCMHEGQTQQAQAFRFVYVGRSAGDSLERIGKDSDRCWVFRNWRRDWRRKGLRRSLCARTFALGREDVAAAREVVQRTHTRVGRL